MGLRNRMDRLCKIAFLQNQAPSFVSTDLRWSLCKDQNSLSSTNHKCLRCILGCNPSLWRMEAENKY